MGIKKRRFCKKGTFLHESIENYYNQKAQEEFPPEFNFFKEFINKYPTIEPYKTEWKVFDSKSSIAGTIDMVYKLSLIHISEPTRPY